MTDTRVNGLRGLSILVAEDEYFLADDIVQALRRQEADVIGPFPEIREILFAIRSKVPNLAILDIKLRGELVYSVVEIFQALSVQVIFVTGCSSDQIPSDYQSVPRWEKPFPVDTFVDALPALVRRSATNEVEKTWSAVARVRQAKTNLIQRYASLLGINAVRFEHDFKPEEVGSRDGVRGPRLEEAKRLFDTIRLLRAFEAMSSEDARLEALKFVEALSRRS